MNNRSKQPIVCFGCGKPGHWVHSPDCPAEQASCGLCHQTGHFEAFCHSRSSSSKSGMSGKQQGGASSSNRRLRLSACSSNDIKTTGSQLLNSSGPIFGTVQLDHCGFSSKFQLKAEVDSGSHCTIVTHSIFDAAFPNNVMHNLHCPILNFDGSEIDSL